MTSTSNKLLIRELTSIDELKASEQFQREVWGDDDPADNADLLLAMVHEGALVAGAYRDEQLLGFLFGFPSSDPTIQHSHRLGVHPLAQGLGLGTRLKWFQRDWCLSHSISTIRWTYDPARHPNASLNIAKLGAVAHVYYENYYGDMAGINAGVPSDRIMAEWHLSSARVVERARGQRALLSSADATLRIGIPPDFDALLREDESRALEERMRIRKELNDAFGKGYYIDGYDPSTCQYTLHRP